MPPPMIRRMRGERGIGSVAPGVDDVNAAVLKIIHVARSDRHAARFGNGRDLNVQRVEGETLPPPNRNEFGKRTGRRFVERQNPLREYRRKYLVGCSLQIKFTASLRENGDTSTSASEIAVAKTSAVGYGRSQA